MPTDPPSVLRLGEIDAAPLRALLARFGLQLVRQTGDDSIAGSFWGDDEAGLRGARLFARDRTPLHSILHEACHFICADPERRRQLDTDAGSDDAEETAVCYLQVVLSDELETAGRERMLADMDAWGYSFRLGASRAWFERDAEDARAWLTGHGLLDRGLRPTFLLRQARHSA